ncbi:MAG: prepilin peptidase [Thomasclavelia sp.]
MENVLLFYLGACFGSFINVISYRMPRKKSFIKGRSYCESCGQMIYWFDLLPLVSYLLLKGRCRYCHQKISILHPLSELISGGLLLLCFNQNSFSLHTLVLFFSLLDLLVIAIIDLKTMVIYRSTLLFLVIMVCIYRMLTGFVLSDLILGMVIVSGIMVLINLFVVSFGNGDIELMIVVGILLGWKNNILAFVISILIGGIISVYLLLTNKSTLKSYIPFGPFLVLGTVITLFYGQSLINGYLGLFI